MAGTLDVINRTRTPVPMRGFTRIFRVATKRRTLNVSVACVGDTAMRLTESAKNKFSMVSLPPLEKKVSSALQLKCNSTLSELVAALAW